MSFLGWILTIWIISGIIVATHIYIDIIRTKTGQN